MPNVLPTERLLVRRLRFSGFYHVVARYGYLVRAPACAAVQALQLPRRVPAWRLGGRCLRSSGLHPVVARCTAG